MSCCGLFVCFSFPGPFILEDLILHVLYGKMESDADSSE